MDDRKTVADLQGVSIEYKNKNLDTVCERQYPLKEYVSSVCLALKRIIMDVEDILYRLQDGRQKSEWDEVAFVGFQRIRHKLLDRAGDIERLPDSLYVCTKDEGQEIFVKEGAEGAAGKSVIEEVLSQVVYLDQE